MSCAIRASLSADEPVPFEAEILPEADGEFVKRGQLIAKCPDGKLGTNLHASIDGTATVIGTSIRIVR